MAEIIEDIIFYGFKIMAIIINIYMMIVTIRRKVTLKWIKNRSTINDLRLCVLLMSLINLLYSLSTLTRTVNEHLYPERSRYCIMKFVMTTVFSYLVLGGLFVIARSALRVAPTEDTTLNRPRILLELGLLLVPFMVILGLSIKLDLIVTYSFHNGSYFMCSEDQILTIVISILQCLVLVFVLTSAIICHRRCKREERSHSLISLSSVVGFMYSIIWFIQIILTILIQLFGAGFMNMELLLVPCIIFPILCLRKKYQLFVNHTEESYVSTHEPVNLVDYKA